jgi:hypothetical protein
MFQYFMSHDFQTRFPELATCRLVVTGFWRFPGASWVADQGQIKRNLAGLTIQTSAGVLSFSACKLPELIENFTDDISASLNQCNPLAAFTRTNLVKFRASRFHWKSRNTFEPMFLQL